MSLDQRIVEEVALARSVLIYHGDKAKTARMQALYGRFLKPGDLAFDIGSHVGDRVAAFRSLGARVVALEPQPALAGFIERLFAEDPAVIVLRTLCGAQSGEATFRINTANPTVSTASEAFVAAAAGAPGWEGQHWDRELTLPSTTLDALVAAHGVPAFVKIDVEGYEADVLAGLTRALPALSFEFTTIQRDVALACLERLRALGRYRFNMALGESQEMNFGAPIDFTAMARHLADLPHEANSGDVYAVLDT